MDLIYAILILDDLEMGSGNMSSYLTFITEVTKFWGAASLGW
jgi:hypothetical protein